MDSGFHRDFRYLDTDADRQELITDIQHVRQQVIQHAESVPQDRVYELRYHGWSLAALLAHLNTIDSLTLLQIKFALIGIHPAVSLEMLNRFNDFTASVFRRRVIATTIRGMKRNEQRIVTLVKTLPIDRFTCEVYHPPSAMYLTAEQALQQYFLFHWQEHLHTLQRVEGIYYEPPKNSTEF